MKLTRRQLSKLINEALGDRGDLPKRPKGPSFGMEGPEDLPWSKPGESFLGQRTIDFKYDPKDLESFGYMPNAYGPDEAAFVDIPDNDPLFLEIAEEKGLTVQSIGKDKYVVDTLAKVFDFVMTCMHEEMGGAQSVSAGDAMDYISIGKPEWSSDDGGVVGV